MNPSKELREGITTGTCAAAATAAACLVLNGQAIPKEVEIQSPSGTLKVEVSWAHLDDEGACAGVMKDAGDDPDVTHGMTVISHVTLTKGQFEVDGGEGIGLVTKSGLAVPSGQRAINPVPRAMILQALQQGCPSGAKAVISIPGGEEVAKKTYNPRLGIVGGLSVLGTKGIVRPMSEEALRATFKADMDVKVARGDQILFYTFGNMGEKIIEQIFGFGEQSLVQVGNELGYMLKEAHRAGVRKILLAGHSGKMIKVAGGIFQTHSSVADSRMEILTALTALEGGSVDLLEQLFCCTTTEAAAQILRAHGFERVWTKAAQRAAEKCNAYLWGDVPVEVCIFDNEGKILGVSEKFFQGLEEFKEGAL